MSEPATRIQPRNRATHWVLGILVFISVGATVIIYFFNPAQNHYLPTCAFHAVTGLHCPGCGATRALHQLLHGHFLVAMRFNALFVVALPFLAWTIGRSWKQRKSPPMIGANLRRPYWIWVIFAVIVSFGILRNLPLYPLTLLAPPSFASQ